MAQLTSSRHSTVKDYLVAAFFVSPMLFIGNLILSFSQGHLGDVRNAGIEANPWLISMVNLGWTAFNWSFLAVIVLLAIELGVRTNWKRLSRRVVLGTCVISIATFLTIANCVLVLSLYGDFRVLCRTQTG